jgi:hypothetical protein
MSAPVLSDEEIGDVAEALMRGTPEVPERWVDGDEILRAVRFFETARMRVALLDLVTAGKVAMRWDDELGDWRLWHVDAEAPAA